MREAIAADLQRVRRDFVDSSRNRYQMNGAVYQRECRGRAAPRCTAGSARTHLNFHSWSGSSGGVWRR